MDRLVCTPAEAARALATNPDTIRELIHSGELPAYQNGTHFKIVIADLEEYIRNRASAETGKRKKKNV